MAKKSKRTTGKRKAGKGKGEARGKIGVGIFEEVERLVGEQKLSRAAAFRQVAKKTGRRVGTVSVNYYRVAHQRGAKLRPRRRRGVGRPRGAQRKGAGARTSIAGRTLAALAELTALARRQEAELARLRKENARLAEIRKLLGRI